ncbi:PhzF family phenazine biosynthesis protein [Phaeodactylibacter luteus]|uniref:PhzF family phenazine biosynthesis protein n=1 Tax=Phaeodactylibacter luteus TaxID=1564516 RepID=A0A5C6RLB6_9BACT|nr:PhzF family phenazine biosynthesis protein [Phaeodactylibacter luteus]TXB62709.1 PhzF family phenazine biosynthesis protein [Phaeodactylibacter luteus]
MKLPIYQIDAFTSKRFSGNPAAVCPLEAWLPDAVMQAIAAENNLSETAFYVQQGPQEYQLRWFTPTVEVDLCGHATLAAAHCLFRHFGEKGNSLSFHSKSGLLSVGREGEGYIMDFPVDNIEEALPPKVLSAALGLQPDSVWMGRDDYLVILDKEEAVAALAPDLRKLREVRSRGVIVSAPGNEVDFVSRCFYPNAGVDEDPVTGSAHTTMTPYWAERLGKQEMQARQLSARGGAIRCTMLGDRVALSGQAVTYLEGWIEID